MSERFNWTGLSDRLAAEELIRNLNVRMPRAARAMDAKQDGLSIIPISTNGAAGVGLVDDHARVQRAVDKVPANGGVVWANPGSIWAVGSTIEIPTDRLVVFAGDGDLANSSGDVGGSVIRRRASFTSGALISQVATGVTHPAAGLQLRGLVLDGNDLAGDLLVVTQMQGCRFDCITFFNSDGNGALLTNCYNFHMDQPRFFEIGNTTAFPNGTASLYLASNTAGNLAQGWITQPHFESGRGSYIVATDQTGGTRPIDGITILGGKMEWSGNQALGFAPASGIGMPLAVVDHSINWQVLGMMSANGFSTAATHWLLQNSANCRFDLLCVCTSGLTDAQNPRYLVNLASSGGGMRVGGTFIRGASVSAGTGAQIRVDESLVSDYQIDPTSSFVSPLSGVAVEYANPTTGRASLHRIAGGVHRKVFVVNPAIATQVINAADGDVQEFNITTDMAVVIQAPSNTPATGQSQDLTVTFFNNSGGVLATAPTFVTGAGAFLLSAAVVNPGNGTGVSYVFRWSPTAAGGARYREVSRTVAF